MTEVEFQDWWNKMCACADVDPPDEEGMEALCKPLREAIAAAGCGTSLTAYLRFSELIPEMDANPTQGEKTPISDHVVWETMRKIPKPLLNYAVKYRTDHPECSYNRMLKYMLDVVADDDKAIAHCVAYTLSHVCDEAMNGSLPVNPADAELLKLKNSQGEEKLGLMRGLLYAETEHYRPQEFIKACILYCCETAVCELDPEVQARIAAEEAAPPPTDVDPF